MMLSHLNQSQPAASFSESSHPVESSLAESVPTSTQKQKQFELASLPAVKIFVKHEAWHRITQPELLQAGLDPNVDPDFLHLYAEAVEQPIKITGATAGPGGFGPQAFIEFYGTGIDTTIPARGFTGWLPRTLPACAFTACDHPSAPTSPRQTSPSRWNSRSTLPTSQR